MFGWRRTLRARARRGRPGRGRVVILLAVAIGIALTLTRNQWGGPAFRDEAQTIGVSAPSLVDVDDPRDFDAITERLYRIVPGGGSRASYRIEERLAGAGHVAVGSTSAVAGEIVVNTAVPALSRVGEIVVNVETLKSDSALRDNRIRHDFLESEHWPYARFAPTSIEGLDTAFADGASYDVSITGDLTVKETTRTETFRGSVTVRSDRLTAQMAAVVLSSDYGVGPINVARLAHTSDEVLLVFELVAHRVQVAPGRGAGGPDAGEQAPEVRGPDEPDADEQDADEPDADRVPASLAADAPAREIPAARGGAARFSRAVQPVLEFNCASCHTAGGPGWSTLALDTAGDAAEIAAEIALVTGIGYMPPWPASDLSPAFEHDRSLTDAEKAELAAWAEAGGALDVAADTPLAARGQAADAIEEDQRIAPRDGPYTGYSHPDGTPVKQDDYRCQVYEVADPEGDGNWLKGFAFVPDQASIVHHSIIYQAPAAAAGEVAAKIASEDRVEAARGLSDEPGWTCFGLSGLNSAGVRPILGWAPGQSPTAYPDGYGLYLAPGDMIVNQIHYHYDHETPADGSWIVLDTADREAAASIKAVTGGMYVTPAEVPCTPEESEIAARRASAIDGYVNMCMRENVLDDIAEKYGAFARLIPDSLVRACGGSVDDYDDLDGSIGHSSCDLPARHTGTVHTVLGHMHEFGAAYRMTLHPDTSREKILLDIPVWDFEWQLNYDPVEDIRIERGDTVRFECWWDRTLQFQPEPRYITWNEGTVDEMCFSTITVLPD